MQSLETGSTEASMATRVAAGAGAAAAGAGWISSTSSSSSGSLFWDERSGDVDRAYADDGDRLGDDALDAIFFVSALLQPGMKIRG